LTGCAYIFHYMTSPLHARDGAVQQTAKEFEPAMGTGPVI